MSGDTADQLAQINFRQDIEGIQRYKQPLAAYGRMAKSRRLYQWTHRSVAGSTSSMVRQGLSGLDQLGLVTGIDRLGQALSEELPTAPPDGWMPASAIRSVNRIEVYCADSIGMVDNTSGL